jgi:sugar (pentulose or hexulose) kinase
MSLYLGIDLGSTSIKGGVLETSQQSVSDVTQVTFPGAVPGLPAGHFEVNPDDIVRSTKTLIRQYLNRYAEIAGIVFSSQMGGVILTDAEFRAVTNYLSWRDQRVTLPKASDFGTHSGSTLTAGSWFDDLTRKISEDDLLEIGNELKPGSAVSLLYWLTATGHLPKNAAFAMNSGDYIVSALCEAPPVTDPTLALGTLQLGTGTIFRELFAKLGFGHLAWPDVKSGIPNGDAAGVLQIDGTSIPCFPAVGDHQAALLGADLKRGELSLNISTGSQVSQVTSEFCPGNYQSRPFFDGQYLNTITHLPAGRSLNALVELLCELSVVDGHVIRDPWQHIARAIEKTASTDLEMDLAFFASSVGDSGNLQKIRLENLTVGHLFIAAFENMAQNYRRCAERICPKTDWTQVVLSGGLPQKLERLRSIVSSQFSEPIRMPQIVEETLQGLLRIAERIENGKR